VWEGEGASELGGAENERACVRYGEGDSKAKVDGCDAMQ
jgi:hypothetical protein